MNLNGITYLNKGLILTLASLFAILGFVILLLSSICKHCGKISSNKGSVHSLKVCSRCGEIKAARYPKIKKYTYISLTLSIFFMLIFSFMP